MDSGPPAQEVTVKRTTSFSLPLAALLLGAVGLAPAQSEAPFLDSIQKDEIKADLYFLSSDGFKGRVAATPEALLAAEYIRSRFERLGLKPVGSGNSYFQNFNLMSGSLGEENLLEVTQSENASLRLRPRQDYYPHRFSASARVKGEVIFAGFGISAPKHSHDDYAGDSTKGKIVLVLDGEPGAKDPESPFDGIVSSHYSGSLQKALTAQDKGAIGILFVDDVHNDPGPGNFEAGAKRYWPEAKGRRQRYSLATWVEKVRIPAAQISPALAETLIRGTGRSLMELARAAEGRGGVEPLPIPGVEIQLTTSVNRHIVPDQNVVGLIEGSDPNLKDEWIILCAHYDHVGVDAGGQVYNGADDDGSGTVALFEIAEAYALAAADGQRPRRSILFAAWDAEESGLLGAWAYTEMPLTPLSKTVAVLNMDMIGRNQEVPENGGRRFRGLAPQSGESNKNTVNIVGHTYTSDLLTEVENANRTIGLEIETGHDNHPTNILRRSDQWPFLQTGVPAVLFTTGFHPDYHTVNDDPQRINYEKLEKIVRLVHQLSWNLAQQDARPEMNTGKPTTDP
jgi:hypothetical protein